MIAFTEYASDLDTGVLIPSEVDTDIVRQIKSKNGFLYSRSSFEKSLRLFPVAWSSVE